MKPEDLGCAAFRNDHNVRYAYVSGGMLKGIASPELVIRMGKAGMLSFLGTGGMELDAVEKNIIKIKKALNKGQRFGVNLINWAIIESEWEYGLIQLLLKHKVHNIEASSYIRLNKAIVYYRLKGVTPTADGKGVFIPNKVMAKLSRAEVAKQFLAPPPDHLVNVLVEEGQLTEAEAALAPKVPMADDVTVEADSAGHTDKAAALCIFPEMTILRDEAMQKYGYAKQIRLGLAGGIGTPQAALAAFMMGADYILTGSINQCTVEAAVSDLAKDLLSRAGTNDCVLAPAGDMFESGTSIQVFGKGLLFPQRGRTLYELYRKHNSLEEIEPRLRDEIQNRWFKRTFDAVWEETREHYMKLQPGQIAQAESDPKRKMALIFRWYFVHSLRLGIRGPKEEKINFQLHCSSAMGAFNQWVKGTELEKWEHRHVDEIGEKLMRETTALLASRMKSYMSKVT